MTRTEHIRNEAGKERTQEERNAFIRGALFADSLSSFAAETQEGVINAATRAGVTLGLLRSPSRLQPLCWARVAVAWKLRELGLSSTAIGRAINRHHSTVVTMWQQADAWFKDAKLHRVELAFLSDILSGRKVEIPEPREPLKHYQHHDADPHEPREAICVECVSYPCFRGIEDMASNLAETCRQFKRK